MKLSGACHYHPMRAGIGICVECRQVVCAECTTPFDGINRCAACLSKLGRRHDGRARGSDFRVGSFVTLLVVFGALFGGLAWAASALAP